MKINEQALKINQKAMKINEKLDNWVVPCGSKVGFRASRPGSQVA